MHTLIVLSKKFPYDFLSKAFIQQFKMLIKFLFLHKKK